LQRFWLSCCVQLELQERYQLYLALVVDPEAGVAELEQLLSG
jgi:hypothetical protein